MSTCSELLKAMRWTEGWILCDEGQVSRVLDGGPLLGTKMLMVTKDGRVWVTPDGLWRMWFWQRRKIATAVKELHAKLTEIKNRPRVTISDSECGAGVRVCNVEAVGTITATNGATK